jgi:hypothetical protein
MWIPGSRLFLLAGLPGLALEIPRLAARPGMTVTLFATSV